MAILQRPYRGSRVSSFYPVKSLPPLAALDSAFQLQEYISLLIRLDVHDVDAIVALPKAPPKDGDDHDPHDPDHKPDAVDRASWIFEQLRRLAQDLSHPLITMLQQECTRSSCPQMKAGEWLYLCVAHGNDGAMEQCCAIDYILHTVDSATALLNSPRAFPSRLSIPQTSHRHFSSLARRLGRIFAHAYFHHREAFEQAEAESSLYARFLKLTNQFDLVPAEFLVIPESAVHHDEKSHAELVEPPRLFSAAVHPDPVPQNDAVSLPDIDPRSRSIEIDNRLATDSPRKFGRSRTDTMVFSDVFSVAEEPSRSEDRNGPLNPSLLTISPVSPDLETREEDLDDEDVEDVSDAGSELTLAAPLSPPVEELSLISLEDTSRFATSPETGADDAPSYLLPQGTNSVEPDPEQPIQVSNPPEEHALPDVDETPTSQVAESTLDSEHAPDPPTELVPTQSAETLALEEGDQEADEPVPSPGDKGPECTEPQISVFPTPSSEPLLGLNEPPLSELVAPESESDITDEVGELAGNEPGPSEAGEEEEAVVRE